jgi:hypothetical protein
MPENVRAWWARRQWSKGVAVPYEVGEFRADWERYPMLIRQYHPDLNSGITLTQIPPVADVYLLWQCEVGHLFVATPDEQRNRPGGQRRRSVWCSECAAVAAPKPVHGGFAGPPLREGPRKRKLRARRIKPVAELPVGEAFWSADAPVPASAAEARLRQLIGARLDLDLSANAVRVGIPFFERLEVWPDILLTDLRVAIEYDTTGRHGLEHVGGREAIDRRKDRILRSAGWEVVRIRCGKLRPLGPHDLVASGVTARLVEDILDRLRAIRGDLIVDCYLVRRGSESRSRP